MEKQGEIESECLIGLSIVWFMSTIFQTSSPSYKYKQLKTILFRKVLLITWRPDSGISAQTTLFLYDAYRGKNALQSHPPFFPRNKTLRWCLQKNTRQNVLCTIGGYKSNLSIAHFKLIMKQDKWLTLSLPDYAHYPLIFNTIFRCFYRFWSGNLRIERKQKNQNKFRFGLNPTKGLRRIRISPIEKKQMVNELRQVI